MWTSCPDVHVELVPPFRSQDRKQSCGVVEGLAQLLSVTDYNNGSQ